MKGQSDAIIQGHVATYLASLEAPRDALLARMEAHAERENQPISDPEVANLLRILVHATQPTQLVEVGTNIGYGAIVLARAAGEKAHVDTVELRAETVKIARGYIEEAGLSSRVTVHEADALSFLKTRCTKPVHFAYIDCVKEDYPAYLDLLAPAMTKGGLIVADNVLWRGMVGQPNVPDKEKARVAGLAAFNAKLTKHAEFTATVLPFGDGVALATKN
jgi:predicted O-methyltransferase YrrM